MTDRDQPFVAVKIGIWDGSATSPRGQLLYRRLLAEALALGMSGGTVSSQVEGSHRRATFRTVESEVSSNELPVWLEFVVDGAAVSPFLRKASALLQDRGIVVCEEVQTWGRQPSLRASSSESKGGQRTMSEAMRTVQNGLQVQIYTLEGNKIEGKPVYQAVAEFLRARDICWISTARGLCGFGDSRQIRKAGWFVKKDEVPIVMTVLDVTERLEPHLPELAELVGDAALISATPVAWIHP